jgi:hypothetical protein
MNQRTILGIISFIQSMYSEEKASQSQAIQVLIKRPIQKMETAPEIEIIAMAEWITIL